MEIMTRSRIMKWSTFLKDVLDWKGMPRRLGVKLVRKKFLSSMYRKEAGDETSSENELDNIYRDQVRRCNISEEVKEK